ncbi:MAG: hypothetical protein ACE5Q6_20395 [Dehalococcoidia bacterium]
MRKQGRIGTNPPFEAAPSVLSIAATMEPEREEILLQLRDLVLALPGATERAVYDGFCREWTPAYYLGERQLCHVHNFRSGLRGSMFIGVKKLEPLILDSQRVSSRLRHLVARTPPGRGTKMVKVPLENPADAQGFLELVRVKWESEGGIRVCV